MDTYDVAGASSDEEPPHHNYVRFRLGPDNAIAMGANGTLEIASLGGVCASGVVCAGACTDPMTSAMHCGATTDCDQYRVQVRHLLL